MSRIPAVFLAIFVCVPPPAVAQEKRSSPARPAEAKKPAPAQPKPQRGISRRTTRDGRPIATPAPLDNRNFFQRVFGLRPEGMPERYMGKAGSEVKPVAGPAPKPESKPKPKTRSKTTRKPAPPADDAGSKPDDSTPPPPKGKTSEGADSTPPKPKPKDKPATDELPPQPKPAVTKTKDAGTPPPPADERERYNAAKQKALEDSAVQDLKTQAETTFGNEEGRKAMRAYNKALFNKMRKVDPSLKERIDGTEAAVMRRLGG